jgi:hypothetical protein
MAITVHTLAKPWMWVEATTGGSLTARTYYFIGYNLMSRNGSHYYGQVTSPVSDQVSVTTDATNNRIKMEIYELGGYVTAYADTGDSTHVTVTSNAHGMSNSDTVYLRGTVNYTGSYTISSVTTNTFDIVATWVADDGASNWYKTPGMPNIPTNFPGKIAFFLKWDNYSMLRGDGTYFQWRNTNDPAYAYEWLGAYGHIRWAGGYAGVGMEESQLTSAADGSKYRYLSATSTSGGPSSAWSSTNLYIGSDSSYSISCRAGHPQIAMRKFVDASAKNQFLQLPTGMDESASGVAIFIDDSDGKNSWDYLVSALLSSGMIGKSVLVTNDSYTDTGYTDRMFSTMILRGCIFLETVSTFTSQPIWYDKSITLINGEFYRSSASSLTEDNCLALVGCNVVYQFISGYQWNQQILSAKNCRIASCISNLMYDTIYTDNTTLLGMYGLGVSSYVTKVGANFLGSGYLQPTNAEVCRNSINLSYVQDCTFTNIRTYCEISFVGERTISFIDCTWYQPYSDSPTSGYNCDIYMGILSAVYGKTVVRTYNHTNSSAPDRADRTLRVSYMYSSNPANRINADSDIKHNFYYKVNATILDEIGDPIEGALIEIANNNSVPDTYSDSTDSDGYLSQTISCYNIIYDATNTDGYLYNGSYPFATKTTKFNNLTIKISKDGYETYNGQLIDVLEERNISITLKTAIKLRPSIDYGDLYLAADAENGSSAKLIKI